MTTKLHIEPLDLAAIDPDDPLLQEHVRTLVAKALELGGNASTAACLLVAAIGTFAQSTDDRLLVLRVAGSLIDEEAGKATGEGVRRFDNGGGQ